MAPPQAVECEFFSPSCDPASFWLYLGIILVLITAAGLMAGLTMGLLSLDMLNMRILEMEGSPIEKERAARVIPILSRHHLLLVTLLLVNAGANEALPIFLSKLVPESISILLSVTCVLLFGEILPSAVFTGPNQLRIAAALTPAVHVLMVVTSPLSYPIAKVLDCWLGADHDVTRYKRQELKALVALQRETAELRRTFVDNHDGAGTSDQIPHANRHMRRSSRETDMLLGSGSDSMPHSESGYLTPSGTGMAHGNSAQSTNLHVDEVTIIHGALDLTAKTVREVMIPIDQVYMLEYSTKLGENVMADILASGHSRIPIYKDYEANIVGLLLVKRLIVVDPEDERAVSDLALRKPIVVSPEASCYYVLNEFQKGGSHIALVTKDAKVVKQCWHDGEDIPADVEFVGIITIEDVIEEIIQEEIEDESDVYVSGVVDYWRTKSARRAQFLEAGEPSHVKMRLKQLAERARVRVRTRRAKKAKQGATASPAPSGLEAPLQIKVVAETTPLLGARSSSFM
jgi:metal transporter CNNM